MRCIHQSALWTTIPIKAETSASGAYIHISGAVHLCVSCHLLSLGQPPLALMARVTGVMGRDMPLTPPNHLPNRVM